MLNKYLLNNEFREEKRKEGVDSTGVSDYYVELRGFHVTLRNTLKNAIKSLRWATRYYKTGVHLPLYSYSTPATPGWPVCSLKIRDMFLFLSLFTCYSIFLLPGIAWLGFSPPQGIYSNVTSEWPSWTILFNISPCTLTRTHTHTLFPYSALLTSP